MEMVHELIDAKIAKMRSDLNATIAAQRALALAASMPPAGELVIDESTRFFPKTSYGPKGRSNNKPKKSTKSRAKTKAAHTSRMAQKRKKG